MKRNLYYWIVAILTLLSILVLAFWPEGPTLLKAIRNVGAIICAAHMTGLYAPTVQLRSWIAARKSKDP